MSRVLTLRQAGRQLGLSEGQIIRRAGSIGLGYVGERRYVRPSDVPAIGERAPPWPRHIADPELALDHFEQRLMASMRSAGVTGLG